MAFQSFQPLRRVSRFDATSKMSASSLISLPRSAELASNNEKKLSIRADAVMLELRNALILDRNSAILAALFPSRCAARSVTALWRWRRAWS